MEDRGVRDQIVVTTKFSRGYRGRTDASATQSNYSGNSTKSMFVSLEASLKKLRTSYVDILYLHWWDWSTSIPEIMKSLNTLADQGKVLYLGVSDTPAWIVSKANQWARDHGLRQFMVYQGKWNAGERDFEREIIPMCEAEGMALTPFGVLGPGNLRSEEEIKANGGRLDVFGPPSESVKAVGKVLEKMAKEKGTMPTSIAIAYVMHKTPYVFPTIGGRTVRHLKENIDALSTYLLSLIAKWNMTNKVLGIKLSPEEIDEIEDGYPFDIGFPLNFLFRGQKTPSRNANDSWLVKSSVHLDVVERPKPIQPRGPM